MNVEKNIATVRKAVKALNEKDMSTIREIMTDNYIRHDLAYSLGERRGQDDTEDYVKSVITAIPDMHFDIMDIFATQNRVAARYTISGTHKGEFKGIPPTGKKIEVSMINLYRFEGDKIAEQWALTDMAGVYRQMGVLNL